MSTTTESTARAGRGVPLCAQIWIWSFLVGLLILIGARLARTQAGTIQPGYQIPDFSLSLFSGYEYNGQSSVNISDLQGKVVFINIWASWCKPCEREAALLEDV